ncbi:MAG: VWA domain-containing protein [Oscillospiraceae bacterium]|nr:VWA domain-containing protein [Oscillospiraceae bacterium]
MKNRKYYAFLTALMMMCACTGCGSNKEMTETKKTESPVMNGIVADGGASAAADAPAAEAECAGEAVADAAGKEAMRSAALTADELADEGFAPEMYAGDAAPGAGDVLPDEGDPGEGDPGEIVPEEPPVVVEPVDPSPREMVSILTAGEWKDHENWGFFANLVNNGTISFPSFGVDPTQRIAVTVKDGSGNALPNASVQLLDAGHNAIWNAVTNKDGVAYLFETNGRTGTAVSATNPGGGSAETAIEAAASDSQGARLVSDRSASLTIEGSAVYYPDTQVMFIVDTTGSMGDEMFYLQSDFAAIAEDVGTDGTSYSVRFYKDEGDAYVTKTGSGFTTDVAQIRSALNAEYADGGGDEPEAVAEALSEAFSSDEWSTESAKVAFLIYDAPPHYGKEDMLSAAIEEASRKGIRLIPVVSSNGSRETELFGRAAAICTGGSYVFLTDDSGVGGSHLEPIIGDYEVEKLHDIIVRIIQQTQQK